MPTAGTDINNIGAWVALILADARTLNRTVFVWEAQATQRELYRLAAAKGVDADALDKVVTKVRVLTYSPACELLDRRGGHKRICDRSPG